MYKIKDTDGFTLLEIMLAISIVGIIISIVFSANLTGFRVLNFNRNTIDAQQAARTIFSRVSPNIRSATKVDTSNFTDDELKIYFPERDKDTEDSYHGMIYGIKENGEFFYKKIYTDLTKTSNKMSLTSEEVVKIQDISFYFPDNGSSKILQVELIIDSGSLKEKIFVERIFLRNTDVIITP